MRCQWTARDDCHLSKFIPPNKHKNVSFRVEYAHTCCNVKTFKGHGFEQVTIVPIEPHGWHSSILTATNGSSGYHYTKRSSRKNNEFRRTELPVTMTIRNYHNETTTLSNTKPLLVYERLPNIKTDTPTIAAWLQTGQSPYTHGNTNDPFPERWHLGSICCICC